jgi:hypothetical protein
MKNILAKNCTKEYAVRFFEAKSIAGQEPNMAIKYGTENIVYTLNMEMSRQAAGIMRKNNTKAAPGVNLHKRMLN